MPLQTRRPVGFQDRTLAYRRPVRRFRGFGVIAVLVLTVLVVVVGFNAYAAASSQQIRTCTVNSKDHTVAVTKSGSNPVYRVYTDQCDVLNIEDNAFYGVYNSASIYGQIKEGRTYQFKTIGWRIPFVSAFPDILEAKEVQ